VFRRKSQIVIEYSYRFREQFPRAWIFWVHASNRARFFQAYQDIASQIGLPGRDDPGVDVLRLVTEWLQSNDVARSWLMVLDNADDADLFSTVCPDTHTQDTNVSQLNVPLSNYLPQTSTGSILITTRYKRAALKLVNEINHIIDVMPLGKADAKYLLFRKLPNDKSTDRAFNDLVEILDCLPLAISQAAAYINMGAPRMTVSKYSDLLCYNESTQTRLLERETRDLRRDATLSNSIIKTWQISFEQVNACNAQSSQLLSLMSVLDRQGIPEFLISQFFKDPLEFEEALRPLDDFSFVTQRKRTPSFEMHRLVQISTRRWLEGRGELEKWREEALGLLAKSFPEGEFKDWEICDALLPHIQLLLKYTYTSSICTMQRATILNSTALYDIKRGRYGTAAGKASEALALRVSSLGESDHYTLESYQTLSTVLRHQGNYEAAEAMNRRVLELREKVLGLEHPDTLLSMSSLASAVHHQGKYEAAKAMDRRVLELREKVLGPEHPDTLLSMSSLASAVHHQGKYEAAEAMNRRVLELREKVLGPEHPDTLWSMSNLASAVYHQGKYEAAEVMDRRVLELREKVLGLEHPDTLWSMSNLASPVHHQGKYEAAEAMDRRVLELREKVLGLEHPDTLLSMSNLASALRYQGKYEAAEAMDRRVLELREKVLGLEHPDTLLSMNNLAVALRCQGKYEAAKAMDQRAMELGYKAPGLKHVV
jgi:tetratricopeptide (TPR) repeat protein